MSINDNWIINFKIYLHEMSNKMNLSEHKKCTKCKKINLSKYKTCLNCRQKNKGKS